MTLRARIDNDVGIRTVRKLETVFTRVFRDGWAHVKADEKRMIRRSGK